MKLKKLYLLTFISLLILNSLFLTSCKKEPSALDTAMAYFNFSMKEEKQEDIYLDSNEIDRITKYLDEFYGGGATTASEYSDNVKKLNDLRIKVAKPITATAEEISNDGNTAVIRLTSTPINMKEYAINFANYIPKKEFEDTADGEFQSAFENYLLDNYSSMVKDPKYLDRTVYVDLELIKKGERWILKEDRALEKLDYLIIKAH